MNHLSTYSGVLGRKNAAHLLRRATYHVSEQRIKEFAQLNVDQAVERLFLYPEPRTRWPVKPRPSPSTGYGEFIKTYENIGETLESLDLQYRAYILPWMLGEMRADKTITSKLSFFLHSIFIIDYNSSAGVYWFDYLVLLRRYALGIGTYKKNGDTYSLIPTGDSAYPTFTDGSFRTFAQSFIRLSPVLAYLTNDGNVKGSTNENLAREFLELFTITPGAQSSSGGYENYTEADVRSLARILTGFTLDFFVTRYDGINWSSTGSDNIMVHTDRLIDKAAKLPLCRFDSTRHDYDPKTFSSNLQGANNTSAYTNSLRNEHDIHHANEELSNIVNCIFGNEKTALAYAKRLYRFYVGREDSIPNSSTFINAIKDILFDNNNKYNIRKALMFIFKSNHFYNVADIQGALVKSPLELVFGALNSLKVNFDTPSTNVNNYIYSNSIYTVIFERCGLRIFLPENVSGYKPYFEGPNYDKMWVTSNTYHFRKDFFQEKNENNDVYRLHYNFESESSTNGVVSVRIFISSLDLNTSSASITDDFLEKLYDLFFVEVPSPERKAAFKSALLEPCANNESHFSTYLKTYIDSTLVGNPGYDTFKASILNIMRMILQSPEYQIM